jgi:acyl dehydratase
MTSTILRAGDRAGPYALPLGPDLVRQFAEATGDHSPMVRDGRTVPPCLLATQTFRAQYAAIKELVPERIFATARSGVHGEHELLVHRAIGPDESLHVFVETHSARPSGENLRVTLRHLILDADDDLVAEQWWTTVLLGTTAEPTGPEPPDHSFSPDGSAPYRHAEVLVDEVMARRYAELSGDFSEHHFSVEAARRSGFEAPFLHGLCTMALCVDAATAQVADGDPGRIRRVALRFATPVFLGERLRVELFGVPGGPFRFEAGGGGSTVIRNGLVELVR